MNMHNYAYNNIPNYRNITSIPEEHSPSSINTSLVQDWSNAFGSSYYYTCENLISLPNPFYDTSNATVMSGMFYYCRDLTTVPNFDTSKVINMSHIFYYCDSLTTVPDFDTSNVTDMSGMFGVCNKLRTIPNFDTSKVTDMSDMFYGCDNITIPKFDTSNVTNMSGMFSRCDNIATVPNFDTGNVTDMSYMFRDASHITTVPNFNTSKVTNMYSMFDCYNLTNVPNFDTSNVTDMGTMFANCRNLATVPNFNTSKVNRMYNMFGNCYNLISIPNFNTSNVTDMSRMFDECQTLTTIPNFDTSNVTRMTSMFEYCIDLTSIPNFNTGKVTDMSNMFYQCHNLTAIPNFDTSNVTDMSDMFHGCDNLTTISNFNIDKTRYLYRMFQNCTNLISTYNFSSNSIYLSDTSYMFNNCKNLITVSNFNTSNVTNMRGMFSDCYKLTTVPNFDTSNVTDMSDMFHYCGENLTTIPIFNTSKVTNMYNMFGFYSCGNFYVTSNNVTNATNIFSILSNGINIYCYANTDTYDTFYDDAFNRSNSIWNMHLKTIEDNYAEIPFTNNGIYRFPTNKIQMIYTNNIPISTIEICPYTDYQLNVYRNTDSISTLAVDVSSYIEHKGAKWGDFTGSVKFRFFKDIINMTPDIIDNEPPVSITIQGLQDPNSEIYVNNKKYNSNPFYCRFKGEQLLEIYSPNYLSISQEINIPKNTSITVNVDQNRNDAAKVTVTPSVSGANITYKYGTMTNHGIANSDGTFYVPKNTDIEYIVKLTGYKTVTNSINISEDTTINVTLEIATYEDINIITPFTDNADYLTNLVDDNNFEISGDYIQSGSSSYHKNNGTSYGYIQFTTPNEVYIDSPIEIECYVSSENNYDYAAVYIGTQVYEPSRTQIKNETTDGNGEFIFAASGNGSLNTYTYSNLLPNTTYYLSFAYAKDSSSNRNSDRFFIKSIKFRVLG